MLQKFLKLVRKNLNLSITVFLTFTVSILIFTPKFEAKAQTSPYIVTMPQYISIRKSPTHPSPTYINTLDSNTIKKEAFTEIINAVGTRGTEDRKLAIGITFDLLNRLDLNSNPPRNNLKESLQKIFDISKQSDVRLPVFLNLDSNAWWDAHPELWNWFDQDLDGFNPANIENVEWTGYNVGTGHGEPGTDGVATKIAWRNWGRRQRVRPHPNYASPKYRAAVKKELDELMPIIKQQYDSLAPQDKYLFAGIALTGEFSIGVNQYYHPNGNSYYDACRDYTFTCHDAHDPQVDLDFSKGISGGMVQLGYNAAKTMGLQDFGNPANTKRHIATIMTDYEDYLTKIILGGGLPTNKIYIHGGGTFGGVNGPSAVELAKVAVAHPGWSLYHEEAQYPDRLLAPFMQDPNNAMYPWSTPEWFSYSTDENVWVDSLENTLNYKNNKLVAINHWEDMYPNKPYAINAVRKVLTTPRSDFCTISPSHILTTVSNDQGTTILNLSSNKPGTSTFINGSTVKNMNYYGQLSNVNLVNTAVDNNNPQITITGQHTGMAYFQLITDGCNGKRVVSEVFSVNLRGSQTCSRKIEGNANCDVNAQGVGIINTDDFDIWRREYLKELNTTTADFVAPAGVGLEDFDTWRITITSN